MQGIRTVRHCLSKGSLLRSLPLPVARRFSSSPRQRGTDHGSMNEPIKYSQSKASRHETVDSFISPKQKLMPKYQPLSVLLSTTVFMLYFFVFREENDLDDMIGTSIYQRIPGLEEKALETFIDHGKKQGIDTTAHETRLGELKTK